MSGGMLLAGVSTYTKRPKTMKRPILLVLGTWLALGAGTWADTASEGTSTKVATLYQQGLAALNDGDMELARMSFTEVLRIQPSHGNARYHLLNLKQRGPELAAKVRKKKLEQIKVPKVDFAEISMTDAIEALGIMIEKETKGKFSPNFIVQDPKGVFESSSITMKLGAVPANVVLEYILRMGDGSARYDEHAIVIRPLSSGKARPASKAPADG